MYGQVFWRSFERNDQKVECFGDECKLIHDTFQLSLNPFINFFPLYLSISFTGAQRKVSFKSTVQEWVLGKNGRIYEAKESVMNE